MSVHWTLKYSTKKTPAEILGLWKISLLENVDGDSLFNLSTVAMNINLPFDDPGGQDN